MENNSTGHNEQFLTEVFPGEFNEIQKRRNELSIGANEPFEKAINACNMYQKAHEDYECASKKKHSLLQRIVGSKGMTANTILLNILGKICSSKTTLHSEKSLEELEEQKNNARKVLKKDGSPSTKLGLVGLALSGGGIRSSTFNLGVIQSLAKRGVLKHIDYLSTVSGGGYVGSCLSSVLNDAETGPEKDEFPFQHTIGKIEPDAFKHLRRNSNYIAPGGLLDYLRIPAIVLRGVLINLFVILPYVIAAVLLTQGTLYCYHKLFVNQPIDTLQNFIIWSTTGLFLLLTFTFPVVSHICKNKLNWNKRSRYEWLFGGSFLIILLGLIIVSIPCALDYYKAWDTEVIKKTIAAIAAFSTTLFTGKAAENVSKWTGKLILYAVGIIGPLVLFIAYLHFCNKVLHSSCNLYAPLYFYGINFLLFIYTRVFVDVNAISLHNFYRDRLSKAYLFKADKNGNVTMQNDKQKLSDLNVEGSKAPYHLINASLNIPSAKDINLRERNADFFIFSKHFYGSLSTGYYNTLDLETKIDPHVDLGTAMAISGAAAAPNMGSTTIKPLVFIMALLNIRLGYWIPNPYKLRKNGYSRLHYSRFSPLTGVGPLYLIKELLGLIREDDKYVNVSDGGHIENLGIYELLRRRCKYIIACDAEADPNMHFEGLAKLIRYARIDLSIDIDIDLDALRKGEDGLSNKHCALGTIRYGGNETGYLLYIKSSLSGDENEYIREYRSENEDFPHESTGDQFFDEAQFEAYRALGYHIADKMEGWKVFESNDTQPSINVWHQACVSKNGEAQKMQNSSNRDVLNKWFEALETSLLPPYSRENSFIEMQEQLSKLEKMYQDPDIAEYAYQVYPEMQYGGGEADKKGAVPNQKEMFPISENGADKERYRKIFHFCNQQMELMENVFIALQLDKPFCRDHHLNRGWMNLFQRWAEAPFFRWTWAASIGAYSIGFQTFCEEVLGLSRMISWRIGKQSELVTCGMDYFEQKKKEKRNLDEIWVADMFVCATSTKKSVPFPVGYIVVNLEDKNKKYGVTEKYTVNVMFYFIQKYYRKMGLLAQMITTLSDALKTKYGGDPRLCIKFERMEDKSQYGAYFERYGFKDQVVSSENV